jgi:hypothetical protein
MPALALRLTSLSLADWRRAIGNGAVAGFPASAGRRDRARPASLLPGFCRLIAYPSRFEMRVR